MVVTGLGIVSPVGTGSDQFFESVFADKRSFAVLPSWAEEFPCKVAGVVSNFKAEEWYKNKKEAKRQSRYMQMGIAASKLAIQDAKLDTETVADKGKFGVLIASAIGGSEFFEEAGSKWQKHTEYDQLSSGAAWGDETFAGRNSIYKGPLFVDGCKLTYEGFKKISPFIVPSFILNSASGVAAVELGAEGPNYCIGGYGGEAAGGALSIAQARRFLVSGEATIMAAGGSESCLTECIVAGYNKLSTLAKGCNEDQTHAKYVEEEIEEERKEGRRGGGGRKRGGGEWSV